MELEGKVDLASSEAIKVDEVPGNYDVEASTEENPPSQFSNSVVGSIAPVAVAELSVVPVVLVPPAVAVEPAVAAMPVANGVAPGAETKKKRGRPRKYGPDGKPLALSPMPISASIPLTGKLLTWKPSKAKPIDVFKKKHKLEFQSPGSQVAYSAGANFTPHLITVNAGEDVSMKIITFAQQGSRVICILSANGSISNVTLRQPNSSGGTLTYEGRFEILSLSGSFKPTDSGGTKSRTGGMSVSLAGPDGRVLGGGLAGLLVAAGPVQVVIGSFLPGYQQEDNPKRQKFEVGAAFTPSPLNHASGPGTEMVFSTPQQSFTPVPYHGTNLSFGDPMQGSTILAGAEKTVSLTEGPKDLGQTKFIITQTF